ncbi:MAG TPA: family 16 glycosylhydrolase, partial [Bacteroidia bacterium]
MSIFCKFDRARIILLLIMSLSTTYSFAQLPYTNPVYDSVFVENFSSGPYIDTAKWYAHYTWGAGNFYSSDTVTGWCGVIQDQANINPNPFDTKNRFIDSGTCKLIALNDTTIGKRWRWYNYPSEECDSLNLNHTNWDTTHCLDEAYVPYKYSSGMLYSKNKIKYGYIEMRFRLPGWTPNAHNGYSINFWLYDNSTSVRHSELDICEIDGRQGRFTNNVHVD